YGYLLVILFLPVEEAEHDAAERADTGKRRGIQLVLPREVLDAANGFVSFLQNECESPLRAFIDQFVLHDDPRESRLRGALACAERIARSPGAPAVRGITRD